MRFTKDELYEIEKLADYAASHVLDNTGRLIDSFNKIKATKLISKIINENSLSYDMLRTISAKCQTMRGEK